MARVTIEDCRKHISNRFELVILTAQRAKDLSLGMPPLIQKTKDKDAVLALREIAAGAIDCKKLRELVLSKHIDPMRKGLRSSNQSADLEEIFKDLAASVDNTAVAVNDGYEHDDMLDLDECCSHHVTADSEEKFEYDEGEDLEDDRQHIKQQQFDIDVSFDDEEAED